MRAYKVSYRAYEYTRVSKARARKLHAIGADVYICPHKHRPDGPWAPNCLTWRDERSFDRQVADFTNSHCSFASGYYPAYYIRVDLREKVAR